MNINANEQQWQALLALLNIGMKAGAYDLNSTQALSFWVQKIASNLEPQEPQEEPSED